MTAIMQSSYTDRDSLLECIERSLVWNCIQTNNMYPMYQPLGPKLDSSIFYTIAPVRVSYKVFWTILDYFFSDTLKTPCEHVELLLQWIIKNPENFIDVFTREYSNERGYIEFGFPNKRDLEELPHAKFIRNTILQELVTSAWVHEPLNFLTNYANKILARDTVHELELKTLQAFCTVPGMRFRSNVLCKFCKKFTSVARLLCWDSWLLKFVREREPCEQLTEMLVQTNVMSRWIPTDIVQELQSYLDYTPVRRGL